MDKCALSEAFCSPYFMLSLKEKFQKYTKFALELILQPLCQYSREELSPSQPHVPPTAPGGDGCHLSSEGDFTKLVRDTFQS